MLKANSRRRIHVVAYFAICFFTWNVSLGDTPSADYIFPAGGQRGTKVQFRVGAHYLHGGAPFEMQGKGLKASSRIKRVKTIWFEGPMIFKPASQGAETYPKDHIGDVVIDKGARPGFHYWRLWTSQGAVAGRPFIVGDLPEIVEKEIDGKPVPVAVQLPVTINGRMFPREDVDVWQFHAEKGQSVTCEVWAQRLGSPLNSYLLIKGPDGKKIEENYDHYGSDSFVRFQAPVDGRYQVHIRDATFRGLQQYIYRLIITKGTHVDSVFPLGGQRGTNVAFELNGQKVPTNRVTTRLPEKGADQHLQYFPIDGRLSNPALIELSDVKEHIELRGSPITQAVAIPTVLNGRVDQAGQTDQWKIKVKKGQSVHLSLIAATLGSPLDGVLVVQDSNGKRVAEKASTIDNPIEPKLSFKASSDGEYTLLVKDCQAERGGPEFAYRLKVELPQSPGFRLNLPTDAVTVSRGATSKLKISAVRQGGFAGEIELSVDGLPKGVTVDAVKIGAKKKDVELVFKSVKEASISTSHIRVVGKAKISDEERRVYASLNGLKGAAPREDVLLAVALPTPFKLSGVEFKTGYAARGTIHRRRYVVDWGDYQGDLTLSLADRQIRHQQGVQAKPMKVKNGTKEVFFPIQLPTWLEMNRTSRTVVMAVGEMDDGTGKKHKISFSSGAVDDQIILLTAPCPMAVSAKRRSIGLRPGLTVELPVKVSRGVLKRSEVTVELKMPDHFSGITAKPVRIAADQDHCVLRIRSDDTMGVINMPATVRATMLVDGDPVIAETKLDLVQVQSN